ncbi:MAG TPA: orotate phosphoribosyltransferase [Hyphomicrobiaceae bacterium]|nr:orotate phosphoribosyltransferase [Hyphomicrobiaceae bacterium]
MKQDLSESRARAFAIIKQRSFRRGRVKLASGKESEYYLDLKPTMFHPEGAGLLARLVLHRLEGVDVDLIGGLEMGAVPLIATVVMCSGEAGRPLPGFFVRKNVKDHGTRRLVEANEVAGKKVVVLEDVTTTGESAMAAVRAARDAGASVVLVLSVVDRQEGATEFFRKQGISFSHLFTADEFLKA